MTAITEVVDLDRRGRVAVLTVNNPPVNALGAGVRKGLRDGIAAGSFRPMPLESAAHFLSAVIQGYQHDKFFRGSKPGVEKDVSDIYAFVLRGISSGN